jgi:hypothetical protein
MEQSEDTMVLIGRAFPGAEGYGLRENLQVWVDLRNAVAHRCMPALDVSVIPHAQAGLLNFENAVVEAFGPDFGLGESLSVPLQLSGFRDPGVLKSAKALQASLPLDVQAILSRADASPELLADPTYTLRVAFLPTVPASGRSPDAVAYFVKPGEMPDELGEMLNQYVVLPKVGMAARPNLAASHVMTEVARRTASSSIPSTTHTRRDCSTSDPPGARTSGPWRSSTRSTSPASSATSTHRPGSTGW